MTIGPENRPGPAPAASEALPPREAEAAASEANPPTAPAVAKIAWAFGAGGLVLGLAAGLLLAQIEFPGGTNVLEEAVAGCELEDTYGVDLGDEGQSLSMSGEGNESSGVGFEDMHCVFEAVDMPDGVLTRIDTTRALDGRQTAGWDGLEASWGYHPDSGLNIVIEAGKE